MSKKFNLIGFNFPTTKPEYKHCIIHEGSRLIQDELDPDKLFCPTCGTSYLPVDTNTEQKIQSKFSGPNQTRIVAPKKKKRYYDKFGNEINTDDPDILNDIALGNTVVYYHEEKVSG